MKYFRHFNYSDLQSSKAELTDKINPLKNKYF